MRNTRSSACTNPLTNTSTPNENPTSTQELDNTMNNKNTLISKEADSKRPPVSKLVTVFQEYINKATNSYAAAKGKGITK